MLKEGREKITPLEVPEWIQEAMLKEQAPWYARVALHTWVLLGMGVLFLVAVFLFARIPFFASEEPPASQSSAPPIEATPVNQPAGDEQMVRLSVATTPSGATVYLNTDSIGVTPLVSRIKKTDIWVLSLQKPDFATFDTVLFVGDNDRAYLHHALRLEELLPAADTLETDALETPPLQPPPASLSNPVASEERTAPRSKPAASEEPPARRDPLPKTSLDTEQQASRQQAVRVTSDSLEAASRNTIADLPAPPVEDTLQASTEPDDETSEETSTASEIPLSTLSPRTQTHVPADLHPIPEMETLQASEAQQASTDSSHSPPRTTQSSRRSAAARSRSRREKLAILEVQGKRTLDVDELGNLTVVTSANVVSPATFLWESAEGVFALGRSINIQFNQAGVYTITVTAKNDYGTDTETLTITVKEPPPQETPEDDQGG